MVKNAIAYVLRKKNRTLIVFIILTVVLSCLYACLNILKSGTSLEKSLYKSSNSSSTIAKKDSQGYFLTRYVDESPEQDNSGSRKEEIVRLKLERGTILQEVSNEPLAYAYDTKLKKMVFLNPENNYRIIMATD